MPSPPPPTAEAGVGQNRGCWHPPVGAGHRESLPGRLGALQVDGAGGWKQTFRAGPHSHTHRENQVTVSGRR